MSSLYDRALSTKFGGTYRSWGQGGKLLLNRDMLPVDFYEDEEFVSQNDTLQNSFVSSEDATRSFEVQESNPLDEKLKDATPIGIYRTLLNQKVNAINLSNILADNPSLIPVAYNVARRMRAGWIFRAVLDSALKALKSSSPKELRMSFMKPAETDSDTAITGLAVLRRGAHYEKNHSFQGAAIQILELIGERF